MLKHLAILVSAVLTLAGPNLARAQAPAAGDGLHVTICGSGGPLPIRDRAKACVAVQAGGALYLVDIGPEATKNMQMWRMPLATAKAVFITHMHSDHIGGLGEFNMQSWVAGRDHPLAVVGPAGVGDLVTGFNLAYGADHGFRRAHHEHGEVKLPLADGLMTAQAVILPAADAHGVRKLVVFSHGGLTVTAIGVNHFPANPALAYRFDYKGRAVVVSGDTIKWPPLAEASKGADVLIHEAQNAGMTKTVVGGLAMMGQPRMSSIMNDTLTYHTTPVEAAEIAKMAGVKALVFYHITQAGLPFYTPEAFTAGVDAVGGPPWRISKDGTTIDLPAGSDVITFGQL